MKTRYLILVAALAFTLAVTPSALGATTNVYVINNNADLYWYEHLNVGASNPKWKKTQIGNGWNFKQVFAGDSGDIYGVNPTEICISTDAAPVSTVGRTQGKKSGTVGISNRYSRAITVQSMRSPIMAT